MLPSRDSSLRSLAVMAVVAHVPLGCGPDGHESARGIAQSALKADPCKQDGDLDGSSDCEDPMPGDPYDVAFEDVGTAAHQERRSRVTSASPSWDGLLYFGVQGDSSPTRIADYRFVVTVLRPGALFGASTEMGLPDFDNAGVWSPTVAVGQFISQASHLAIFPEPARGAANPYRSACVGGAAPTADPNGACLTYRFGLVGAATRSDPMPEPSMNLALFMAYGTVVVANPSTADASVAWASFDQTPTPEFLHAGDALLVKYEPSISFDGHLLVWHGCIDNLAVGGCGGPTMYSFNPVAGATSGWSAPKSITQMYATHGAGAADAEPLVDGVGFSARYPIAQQPLLADDGLPLEEFHPGPYPWLSFDGSEIFFPQVIVSPGGPTRSAMAAIGARTRWRLQHLDGAINPMRATLTTSPQGYVYSNHPEYPFLLGSYNLNVLGADSLSVQAFGDPAAKVTLGKSGFQRIFVGPVALSASQWTPFSDATSPLPRDSRAGVYGFLLSHSNRYVEVPLTLVEEGNTVFALPMNERLAYDRAGRKLVVDAIRQNAAGTMTDEMMRQVTSAYKHAMTFDATQTPDIIAGQHGTLNGGAQFPFEAHDARATWAAYWATNPAPGSQLTAAPISGDRIEGAIGNAVYFPPSGSVTATLSATSLSALTQAHQGSVDFWFRAIANGGIARYALFEGAGFGIEVSSGQVVGKVGSATCGAAIDEEGWHHVALTRAKVGSKTKVMLYVDGEAGCTATVAGDLTAAGTAGLVTVGPNDTRSPASSLLLLIDEVSVAKVARTSTEIRQAALRRPMPPAADQTTADFWGPTPPSPLEKLKPVVPGAARSPEEIAAIADLGRRLFIDPALSDDGSVSCSTCHVPNSNFVDSRALCSGSRCPTSVGIHAAPGRRNTPSISNRLFGAAQFWDGRAQSLELQAIAPLVNPNEMGNASTEVLVARLQVPTMLVAFEEAFGTPVVDVQRIATALATYERTLLSGDARYDRQMLTPPEQRGQALFFGKARCASCHRGSNFTDERFHAMGFDTATSGADRGQAEHTGRRTDKGRFKTPSLRDVARTEPYYHDGRFATLAEVVEFYNAGGDDAGPRDLALMPLGLSAADRGDLVAFLKVLNGSSTRRSEHGESLPPLPEVIAASMKTSGSTWMAGWFYGTAPRVELDRTPTFAAAIEPARVNFAPATTPSGYSGAWNNVTFTVPEPLRSGAVYARVVNGTLRSAPIQLR